eukprot:CAMPEP_0202369290 /NCGR_PEP_ID=MMETSP1127-20130417/1158_1 /ASSEMBLY_ACC=CAM_ASM_000462 /TAXON_ID=3047 /ORGANISM="Dunaliella tertiolecta, Strain CCMP1320" /LENGTH=150 /DNA_ID=CAMNT_0048964907 /DNA_START=35 /DNA_END=485 /DNA_ORIENTATION=-
MRTPTVRPSIAEQPAMQNMLRRVKPLKLVAPTILHAEILAMSRWQPLPEEYIGPVSLTLWILFMSALGFFTGPMNSVSVWYQLLTAAMPSLAIMLLWLTCLSDPGMIPPSCTRDPIIDQLEFARAGEDEERHSQTPKEGYSKEPGERGAW